MFNIGSGEIALIAVVALLILGPKRLPELARGIGKFMREFRRQTDEVRGVVEREFYKMDQEVSAALPQGPVEEPLHVKPAQDSVALGQGDGLGHSQLTAGMPHGDALGHSQLPGVPQGEAPGAAAPALPATTEPPLPAAPGEPAPVAAAADPSPPVDVKS
jgi:sec-independent protein translocase protein TatB